MLSNSPRCIYRSNPLAEVICQLRFPEILSIETDLPAKFQDAIRNAFPRYSLHRETSGPGPQVRKINNYQFASEDGKWRINLTSNFISLSCSLYTRWEEFAAALDAPLASFIQIYKPACFDRIGLRYINFISREELNLQGVAFRELIAPCYLGILEDEDIQENSIARSSVDAELSVNSGCRVKLHAGPGKVARNGVNDPEIKFVFDQDLFINERIPVNYSAAALETLHKQAYRVFRGAISSRLHHALEPEEI